MYAFFQWGLWVAGAGLQALILWRLVRSRLFRQYPFLTAYFTWQVIRVGPLMFAYRYLSVRTYSWLWWSLEVVSWALIFLVILELYDHSLREYQGLRRICRLFVSRASLLIMLFVCGSIVWGSVVEADPRQWINTWLFLMQRSIRLVHTGMLLGLVAFLAWFQIHTSALLRYLTLGWLADRATGVAGTALRYHFGPAAYPVLTIAMPLCAVVILGGWYWALSRSYAPAEARAWPARELTSVQADLLMRRLELIEATLGRAYH
jgi:hypothetical protein